MVEEVNGHISHHVVATVAVTTLGHPNEIEESREFVALAFEIGPLCFNERIPIEALEHHAFVFCGPTLCGGGHDCRASEGEGENSFFHVGRS